MYYCQIGQIKREREGEREREREPFPFRENSGVRFDVMNKEDPVELFEHFFDDEVIDYFVTETTVLTKT